MQLSNRDADSASVTRRADEAKRGTCCPAQASRSLTEFFAAGPPPAPSFPRPSPLSPLPSSLFPRYGPGLMSAAVRSMTMRPFALTAKSFSTTLGGSPGMGALARSGP